MSYKWFLGLTPESDVIDPSSLTKFRKQRLSDDGILDKLIAKSVKIAVDNGLIKSKDIIVDSTHTCSRSNAKVPVEVPDKLGKSTRKALYGIDGSVKDKMPQKYEGTDLEKEMEYVEKLVAFIKGFPASEFPAVKKTITTDKKTEVYETEEFREKYRTRYKIEAKNAVLKNNYGYGVAESYGLHAMTLQGAVAMFASNMRRIVRMMDEDRGK